MIYIGILLLIGIAALIGMRWYESSQSTGEAFARIYYKDEMILQIDLHTCEYVVYDTPYASQVIVQYASEGLFYVPGTTTVHVDPEDENVDVALVKLAVDTEAASIEVVYQESPRDICEIQGASNSSLRPIVCLPNELVITVITDDPGDHFVPDGELS